MIESHPLTSIVLLAIALRPLVVLLHEFGHAIAAYRVAPQVVSIYLGSYGDQEKSANVQFGRFSVWVTSNPLLWQRGICIPSLPFANTRQHIAFVLAGPFAPVLVSFVVLLLSEWLPPHPYVQVAIYVFCGVTLLDLFYNLIPNEKPLLQYEGMPVFNDGYTLKLLLTQRRYPDEYFTAMKQFENGEYEEAAKNFEWTARRLPNDEDVHRNLATCYSMFNNLTGLKEVYEVFDARGFVMSAQELVNAGFACSHLNDHVKALEYYERALKLEPENKYALNNKAFTLQVFGKLEDSIVLLDQALGIDPQFDDAINNRGYARMKLGDAEAGLADINRARELNPDNAYVYRNLGIFNVMNGNRLQALAMFRKAKELDPLTYNIDRLIAETAEEQGRG